MTVALLLLAACGESSTLDPDAAVSISGRFTAADGTDLADRPVQLRSGVTAGEAGLGILTVGLSCLGGGCARDAFHTSTDAGGAFRYELTGEDTQSGFGEASRFVLSTSATAPDGRPSGPSASASFVVQTTDVRLPSLPLVDVAPEVAAGAGTAVEVTWDGGSAPAPYEVGYVARDGGAIWSVTSTEARSEVDGRVLEDFTGLVSVSTTRTDAIEGSDLEVVNHSSGAAFRGAYGPPPSRGASCELLGPQGEAEALEDCPVTDGLLGPAVLASAICPPVAETTASTMPCAPVRRVRVPVEGLELELVVVRGCASPCTIEVVGEDRTVAPLGPVSSPDGAVAVDRRPISAVDVVTDDVSALREVSLWSGVDATAPPFRAVGDPERMVGGTEADGGRPVLVAVAVAALAVVLVLLGVWLGRRSQTARR